MQTVKTVPVIKSYLWGGKKLTEYNKQASGKIAESWEFSLHPDGLCEVCKGKTLYSELIQEKFFSLGKGVTRNDTPIIKFINSSQPLSVQVHPLPEQGGKNEMWIILEAEPDSALLLGDDEILRNPEVCCRSDELPKHLKEIKVKAGETYFIPAGTVHAIGKGLTVLEIQQNSNLTYRLYDYNRTDDNGKSRPLHIKEAIKAIRDASVCGKSEKNFFAVTRHTVSGKTLLPSRKTFFTVTVIRGEGMINNLPAKKGDTFFIPCQTQANLSGNMECVEVHP